jgi:hypothetical protein
MPFRALLLLALATALLPAQSADWSAVQALRPGERVRVETTPRPISGQFQSASEDRIVLRAGGSEQSVERSRVTGVAVRKPGHRKRNALLGLGVGVAAGLGIGAAARNHSCTGFCIQPVSNAVILGAGATAGGLAGVVVGAVLPTGGWRDVYFSRAP